jgi:hypothetical protein
MSELQLTEDQEKALYQANIRLTVLYLLPDVCEALMQDILDLRKKAGVRGMKFEQKKYWNAFFKDSYNLRKVMKTSPKEIQSAFADSCELIQTLILAAIDRCGDADAPLMFKFIDYIKSFPSKRGIEIDD